MTTPFVRRLFSAALGAAAATTASTSFAQTPGISQGSTRPNNYPYESRFPDSPGADLDGQVDDLVVPNPGGGNGGANAIDDRMQFMQGSSGSTAITGRAGLGTSFAGMVTGVADGRISVKMAPPRVAKATEQVFTVSQATAILVNGEAAELNDIREGDTVRVTTMAGEPTAAVRVVAVGNPANRTAADPAVRPIRPGADDGPRADDRPTLNDEPAAAAIEPDDRPADANPRPEARGEDEDRNFDVYPDKDTARPATGDDDGGQGGVASTGGDPLYDFGLSVYDTPGEGVLVTRAVGYAAQAGLLPGDYILAAGSVAIMDPASLAAVMRPGATLNLQVYREQANQNVQTGVPATGYPLNGLPTPGVDALNNGLNNGTFTNGTNNGANGTDPNGTGQFGSNVGNGSGQFGTNVGSGSGQFGTGIGRTGTGTTGTGTGTGTTGTGTGATGTGTGTTGTGTGGQAVGPPEGGASTGGVNGATGPTIARNVANLGALATAANVGQAGGGAGAGAGAAQPGAGAGAGARPGAGAGVQPGANRPGANRPNQPMINQPGGPTLPGGNQPGVNRPGANQPGATRPGVNQPGAVRPNPGTPRTGVNQNPNQNNPNQNGLDADGDGIPNNSDIDFDGDGVADRNENDANNQNGNNGLPFGTGGFPLPYGNGTGGFVPNGAGGGQGGVGQTGGGSNLNIPITVPSRTTRGGGADGRNRDGLTRPSPREGGAAPKNLANLSGVGIEDHGRSGVVVTSLSPRTETPLQKGDIILAVNARPVDNVADLEAEMNSMPADTESVEMVVLRGGDYHTIKAPIIQSKNAEGN